MKLPLTILLLTVALALQGAQTVIRTIEWNYGDARGIIGFRVYWGPTSGVYTASRDVLHTLPAAGNYIAKIAFPPGSFVTVTAIGADGGESGWSNEVQI